MDITITIPDAHVEVCETQVEDLTVEMQRECDQRVDILMQKAGEEAQQSLGKEDTIDLVTRAGLTSIKSQSVVEE